MLIQSVTIIYSLPKSLSSQAVANDCVNSANSDQSQSVTSLLETEIEHVTSQQPDDYQRL